MPWLKWHDGTTEDAKLQTISRDTGISVACIVGVWAALLEGAASVTHPGKARNDLPFLSGVLRVTVTDLSKVIDGLERYRCARRKGDYIEIINWERRQFSDKTAAARQRRYRARKKEQDNTALRDGDRNSDRDTRDNHAPEQNRTEQNREREQTCVTHANGHTETDAPKRRKRRGTETPIANDWEPTADAYTHGATLGIPRFDVIREAQKFATKARAKDWRYVNWDQAFQNWLIKAAEYRARDQQALSAPATPGRGAMP